MNKPGRLRVLLVATGALFVFVLTPSVASAAVTVTTEPTSSFDKNAAYICGDWTADGPGLIEFEYGLDTSYGSTVGFASTDIDQTSGSDCITIFGLTPSTTYHYRFVFLDPVINYSCPCVEYDGSDQTVTTNAGSAPEITGPTTAGQWDTHTGFTVVTGIDAEGYPTTWQVDYGPSPSDLSLSTTPEDVLVWPNGPVSLYTDSAPLPANHVYYWQIVATNTLGTTKSLIGSVTLGTISYPLTIAKVGTGSGTVVSYPLGITCGSTCSKSYASGTSVTLSASPAFGSTFAGWSGGGCSGNSNTCTVTVDSAQTVTASFEASYTLTVATNGSGSGKVISSPTGIACGSSCSHDYASGTSVTLTAAASSGSKFAGWSGSSCSGTGVCTVVMSGSQSVQATFASPACIVPKLKGKTLNAARHAIRSRGCVVGKIGHAFSKSVKRGHVISQRPTPGRHLKRGAKVNLVISKGKRP